ncbi:MAG: right-handed parallel beta-helix repeat-containing protein [Chloroflexi bacterium]|nr:right-handed parallel beta-helix repeat-containing protein [Chloroflexota bacterium]
MIDVAADRHPQDGFHWSYTTRKQGVSTTRLSGCRASLNGRNGVSITQGSGNIVDRCRIEGNNRGELVAGIDLEPDQGLSVTGSKIVANYVANNPNNGIQAYVAYNGFATLTDNAICDNAITGNRGTGLYDFKSGSNLYVSNATGGNGQAEVYHDTSPRIGGQYRGACQLPDLPPPPGTGPAPVPPTQPIPTPTAPARPSCEPRPAVSVTAQPGAPGTLVATITVSVTGAAPNNQLRSIQFGPTHNATLEVGGQSRGPGGFTLTPPAGTRQIQVVIRRTTPGQPVTAPLTITDDCGSWPSFVGGGPTAF